MKKVVGSKFDGQKRDATYDEVYTEVYSALQDSMFHLQLRGLSASLEQVQDVVDKFMKDFASENLVRLVGEFWECHKDLHSASCTEIQEWLDCEKGVYVPLKQINDAWYQWVHK